MNTINIILGTLGTAFAVVMTALSMINYRKPRKITLLSTFLSGILSLAGLGALLILGGMWLEPILGVPLFLVGILLGYLRGAAVKLCWEEDLVIGRNSVIFLVLWGLSLALSQLLGMLGSPLLASLGLIPVLFTTGLQAGFYGLLFTRRLVMGRQGKDRKTLQTVITIGGSLALLLLTLVTLLVTIPEVIDSFPMDALMGTGSGNMPAAAYEPANTPDLLDPTPDPGLAQTGGFLPQSGSMIINCDDYLQEEMDSEEEYPSMQDREYTFDEIFESYLHRYDVQVDLDNRIVMLDEEKKAIKRDLLYDPDYDGSDNCPLYIDIWLKGEGSLYEDGWISGNFNDYVDIHNCTGGGPESGSNEFYGFLDEQLDKITFCFLPTSSWLDQEDYAVVFEDLRSAGKENLQPNWWNPDACHSCVIEGVSD